MATRAQEAAKSPFSKRLNPPPTSDRSLWERLRNRKKKESKDEERAIMGEWGRKSLAKPKQGLPRRWASACTSVQRLSSVQRATASRDQQSCTSQGGKKDEKINGVVRGQVRTQRLCQQ